MKPSDWRRECINVRVRVRELVTRYGMIDGAHHKQWLLDQIMRAVLPEDQYGQWRKDMDNDPEHTPWDEGIAP